MAIFVFTAFTILLSSLGVNSQGCPNPPNGFCGGDNTCCPTGYYCQPLGYRNYPLCTAIPPKCPEQLVGIDLYGYDIKSYGDITPAECCEKCSQTAGCVAYTYVNSNYPYDKCFLKSSTAGRVAKAGAVSGILKVDTNPKCPEKLDNTDFYGNDLKSNRAASASDCCDKCSQTSECVGYSYINELPSGDNCFLKKSIAGRVAKPGVTSGALKTGNPNPKCPDQQDNIDFYGYDIANHKVGSSSECCDKCSQHGGCVGYTYIKQDVPFNNCFLKSSTAGRVAKDGVVSAALKDVGTCTTSPWAWCGNSQGYICCPSGYYCQPWNSGYYQCISLPGRCKQQYTDTDFYGNDIKTLYGLKPEECCTQCGVTAGCKAYTFVNTNPNTPACYLKSGTGDKRKVIGAVSGILN